MAVQGSSNLAVPLGTGPGYDGDALRTGRGGAAVDEGGSGNDAEQLVSVSSVSTSKGLCYNPVTSSPLHLLLNLGVHRLFR